MQRVQRLLEARHRFVMGRTPGGLTTGEAEKGRRLVPRLAMAVVRPERQRVRSAIVRVHVFQALGDATMERGPQRAWHLTGRDLADVVVAEFQPIAGAAQHPMSNELLHTLRRLAL